MAAERLDPDAILAAYTQGAFPMTDPDGVTRWYTADPRGVIPLDRFHVPHTLRRLVAQKRFEIRINGAFERTIRACMLARPDGSWISEPLVQAYVDLHRRRVAHSVEAWEQDELVGGLYGVAIGGAFFGESMFHTRSNASKVALVGLVQRLRERNFLLLDTQASTPHLKRFGCIEIPARQYMRLLSTAISKDRQFD
ncbi:MAG TPA: leucyl/phenylalanyl-tRNA--protein transferase [Tepidisphaeraceae bacterium]|nr:leucyl/phenylalanyl-tRNA--protein transferase [Tepidisphaeraceae bacterium]